MELAEIWRLDDAIGRRGGQNVNKVETAVRIKHLPTGITVRCEEERSAGGEQGEGRRALKAKLAAVAEEQRAADVREIGGDVGQGRVGSTDSQLRVSPLQDGEGHENGKGDERRGRGDERRSRRSRTSSSRWKEKRREEEAALAANT